MTHRQMMTMDTTVLVAACLIGLTVTPVRADLTPAAQCQALKNKEAGRYAFCLEKAQ